ncbi:MAG TPA: hypothetical protein VK645_07180 [Chitinophagaceae bacterium]|nr:hypothetical protein [Chitinophagaceae bacterium]
MNRSSISIFIDDESSPVAQLDAPVSFELDTRQMTDGRHVLKIVSHGPHGNEDVSQIDFEVKNGPAIAIEGIRENALVGGVLPLMINAYSKGDQPRFIITGSETTQIIPYWLWLLIIGVAVWGVYYFVGYINV